MLCRPALATRWLNIGPMLTVVDGASARFDFRRLQARLLKISAVPLVLGLMVVSAIPAAEKGPKWYFVPAIVSALLYLVLLGIYTVYRALKVRTDFAGNLSARHRARRAACSATQSGESPGYLCLDWLGDHGGRYRLLES